MRTVTFTRQGKVVFGEREAPPLSAGEVAVSVDYAGINPTDLYHLRRVLAGSEAPDRGPGVEVSGIVAAVSPGVTKWQPGDRVLGLVPDGGLAQRVNVHENMLVATPTNLDPLSAAAVPEVFITAHDAIVQGRLKAGETLLVTGASGSVGLAAVQIGVAMGARVLGVCRSGAGRELVGSLGADPYPDHGWQGSERATPYRDSVDVVVELVGAVNVPADLASLRTQGRIVVIAAQGDEEISFNLREFKTKRATLIGSTLRRRGTAAKIDAVATFAREVLPFLQAGLVRPIVSRVFAAQDVAEAFEFMNQPGKLGKVLLDFR